MIQFLTDEEKTRPKRSLKGSKDMKTKEQKRVMEKAVFRKM